MRDTAWNLAGLVLPLPVAIAVVPALLTGLGDARFGLLTLAWALMGYFTLFDFGLGRATTQGIAEARVSRSLDEVLTLSWNAFWAHLALGVAGGLLLKAAAAPIGRAMDLTPTLHLEYDAAMTWLAVSIPFIVLATAARGVLEGVGRFDSMNVVRLPSTLWTYLAPLAVVSWTTDLGAVVAAIAVGRVLALGALLWACVRAVPDLAGARLPHPAALRPLAHLGIWITVATVAGPVMSTLDRLIIGTRVSVEAVGWYAAPYEAVTRLWIISTAVMTVAFPAFTAAMTGEPSRLGTVFRHALAALVLVVVPAAMAVMTLAPVAIPWWLGHAGGRDTVLVAQWLAAGTAINVVAQAGSTLLQATKRAEWVARVQVGCVAAYGVGIWWAAGRWGIVGVAGVWVAYALVAAVLTLWLATTWTRTLGSDALSPAQWRTLAATAATCLGWAAWLSWHEEPGVGTAVAAIALTTAATLRLWQVLVDPDMKQWLLTRAREVA
jgi:O-antigen/teichoic acid export membrane protein